jgi:protein-L-isoaspartate(D-aspartate) O-methyltransferase
MSTATDAQDFAAQRSRMVAEVEAMYGETKRETGLAAMSSAVRAALGKVERHRFVPPAQQAMAYRNHPLPIGNGQTISQPYIVALSTDLLRPEPQDVVLEVGTGSGYQAAVLAEMGARVISLERIPRLAEHARGVLERLGYADRVTVEVADGTLGWPPGAPYDAIVVTAGAPQIPRPLIEQLGERGRLVLPMGEDELQTLVRLRRGPEGLVEEYLGECRFVKLLGSYGWEET